MTVGIFSTIVTNLNKNINVIQHNELVARDSVEIYKGQYNTYYIKSAYYKKNLNEASKLLNIKDEQIKELKKSAKKDKAKIEYLTKINTEIKIDTVEVPVEVIVKDTIKTYNFNYNTDPWLKFHGELTANKDLVKIYDINIPNPMIIGLDDKHKIHITSNNPYLQVTDIKALSIPGFNKNGKYNPWGFCIYAGWGIQYDLLHNTFGTGPQIGIGVSYKIYFKKR